MLPTNFWRQTWALTKKNLRVTLVRCWLSTSIRALVLPILLLVLLLEIPSLSKDNSQYGVGDSTPVQSLAKSMQRSSKPLAIVRSGTQGADADVMLDRLTSTIESNRVKYIDNEKDINKACVVDYYGNSQCHAVFILNDSPGSGRVNGTWNYTIKADPTHDSGGTDVNDHEGDVEGFFLPLQLAIDNAILNSSVIPEANQYTTQTQTLAVESRRQSYLMLDLYVLSFVFFITMVPAVTHVSSMFAADREKGLSALEDAMTGGVAWARVLSYVITFDILYLPLWIILGVVYSKLLTTTSSAGIAIIWQVLTGWAVTSASIFGATFFRRATLASTIVTTISFLMGVVAAVLENLKDKPSIGEITALSLFFPSMNYVFFIDYMIKSELAENPVNMNQAINATALQEVMSNQPGVIDWVTVSGPYFSWICLAVQIIGYFMLASLVEKFWHGNNRRRREFDFVNPEVNDDHVAIATTDLTKHYTRSGKQVVKAVDGLSLTSQRSQILCLLGPNGSGKTTTLDILAGFQTQTGGSVTINTSPSQIGVCPQKNVLWGNLTVMEHLRLWSALKGGAEEDASPEELIQRCDLSHKKFSLAKTLSGGSKRKLQLACMLVGGSSVCLLDEVTSGLDPLSRRVIWNVILAERAHRTMVFTTHSLDECEVLSDHVVILSLGRMKCQGTPAELKNAFGDGYRVHIPKTRNITSLGLEVEDLGDRYVCKTPDSSSAAQLLARLDQASDGAVPRTHDTDQIFVTGPTIENVFLKVSDEPHARASDIDNVEPQGSNIGAGPSEARTRSPVTVFFIQLRALFIKRIIVLRSQWFFYFLALAIAIIPSASTVIGAFIMDSDRDGNLFQYIPPGCDGLLDDAGYVSKDYIYSASMVVAGPNSSNASISWAINAVQPESHGSYSASPLVFLKSPADYKDYFRNVSGFKDTGSYAYYGGGLYIDNSSAPMVTFQAGSTDYALMMMNAANVARGGIPIHISHGFIRSYSQYQGGYSIVWITIFCLLQAMYPAFFALYPTYERRSQVRALQYSNGIRALPLWAAYLLFDLIFILVISILCVVLISPQAQFFGLGYICAVFLLYGIASTIQAYIVSMITRSQPAALTLALLISIIEYILCLVAAQVISAGSDGYLSAQDGTTFGLGLIFPIQNVLRSLTVGVNYNIVLCRGKTEITQPGHIYAHGGPILLLIIQVLAFIALLMWLDGTVFSSIGFTRLKEIVNDHEKEVVGSSGRLDVDAETARVEASQSDLLRMLHVTKRFGNSTAVDDVSLGLRSSEVLALLGPNGAGKSTSINMIRGDLKPTSGRIFLRGTDIVADPRVAHQQLGVCPQFDALDKLTVREHLYFYARCKCVADIKADVDYVIACVGLGAHAQKLAAKLSGGNKRKLSLAIALLGNPPVLLLDEPSSAMDAVSKRVLWRILRAVAPGRSILITTHSMEEADALATRAAILARRLLAVGTTQDLRRRHSNEYHVHLVLRSAPVSAPEQMEDLAYWVQKAFPSAEFEGRNLGGQVRFVVPADEGVGHLIETLEQNKEALDLECYSIGAATMERVFLSVVKETDAKEIEEEEQRKASWWSLGR